MDFRRSPVALLAFGLAFSPFARSHGSESIEKQDDVQFVVAYSLSNLPVWQIDEAGNSHLDASILISHIRSSIAPASWENDARIFADNGETPRLIVMQTQENHQRVALLIWRLSAFSHHDASKKLAAKLRDAKISDQHVLVFVGDANSRTTQQFFDLQHRGGANSEFDDYLVQYVSSSDREFLEMHDIGVPEKGLIVLISSDGQKLANIDIENIVSNGTVDGERLGAFLDSHRPEFAAADVTLQEAISRADRENKKVWVQVGGPRCGPCIELSRFLAKHNNLINQDYVLVKLDSRMPNSDKVTSSLGREFKGIPWMAILSESGETLITSEGPGGNIAFPRTDEQKSHFRTMLESTSTLSKSQIDVLLAGLPKSQPLKPPAP